MMNYGPLAETSMQENPGVVYATLDQVSAGVGRSQVAKYVSALAREGHRVVLHSFENTRPSAALAQEFAEAGVEWISHPFGGPGFRGGIGRVLRLARALRAADGLVHARSELAFLAAVLARSPVILWDMRSFWADQRVSLGEMKAKGLTYRFFRRVERYAAHRSAAIVTLTTSALRELAADYPSAAVSQKAVVVSTCADLDTYRLSEVAEEVSYNFLLAGSLNTYYDVPLMLDFVAAMAQMTPVSLRVLAPEQSPWTSFFQERGLEVSFVHPQEVPAEVRRAHAGLSVCRLDAGRSLTAAMPTKLGEFLATGRPVVVNRGLGDMDRIVDRFACGVIIGERSDRHLRKVADRLWSLSKDPDLAIRCREAAEAEFNLKTGVQTLSGVYKSLTAEGRSGSIL